MTREEIIERLLALDEVGEAVICTVCERRKQPRGRHDPMGRYLCDSDCPGYYEEPRPQHLHPCERASDFGFTYLSFDGSKALWSLIRDVRAAEAARKERAQEAFDAIPCDEEAAL